MYNYCTYSIFMHFKPPPKTKIRFTSRLVWWFRHGSIPKKKSIYFTKMRNYILFLIIFQMCKTRMEKKLKSFDPVLCEQMTAELLIPVKNTAVKNTEINPRNQILKMCFMLNLTFQHSRIQWGLLSLSNPIGVLQSQIYHQVHFQTLVSRKKIGFYHNCIYLTLEEVQP